jgi:hypothetical protein
MKQLLEKLKRPMAIALAMVLLLAYLPANTRASPEEEQGPYDGSYQERNYPPDNQDTEEVPMIFWGEEEVSFQNVTPILSNGVLLAPLNGLLEELDFIIEKEEEVETVRITGLRVELTLQVGEYQIDFNGGTLNISEPMQLIDGVFFVPLIQILELDGVNFKWDPEDNTLIIESLEPEAAVVSLSGEYMEIEFDRDGIALRFLHKTK